MITKMMRRRRHDRRKRILTHRREDALFFAYGTVPASAQLAASCPCGASVFSRDNDYTIINELFDSHSYCSYNGGDYEF